MKKKYIKPGFMAYKISKTSSLLCASISLKEDYYDEDDNDLEDL